DDVSDLLEQAKLVEVRCRGIANDADRSSSRSALRRSGTVFVRKPVSEPGKNAERRDAGELLELGGRGRKQGAIAAELVQHEAADELALFRWEKRPGAVEVREGAASVDGG